MAGTPLGPQHDQRYLDMHRMFLDMVSTRGQSCLALLRYYVSYYAKERSQELHVGFGRYCAAIGSVGGVLAHLSKCGVLSHVCARSSPLQAQTHIIPFGGKYRRWICSLDAAMIIGAVV